MNWRKFASWGVVVGTIASIVLGMFLWAQPRWALQTLAPAICPGAAFYAQTEAPVVALTLDDGPSADPAVTAEILEILAANQARATFFLIGDHLQDNTGILERIVSAGHEIGNHLWADRPTIASGPQTFADDLVRTEAALGEGQWLRPGGGFCSRAQQIAARERGYHLALGSIWPYDTLPGLPTPAIATRFVLANLHPGAILVLHDRGAGDARGRRTARTLANLLPQLQRRGYRCVTLSELAATGRLVPPADHSWPTWADRLRGRAIFGFFIRTLTARQQLVLLGLFGTTNLAIIAIGIATGFLRWEWLPGTLPTYILVGTSLRLLFFPALLEEWLFRGLFLPAAAELDGWPGRTAGTVALLGLCLYVAAHLPSAVIADRLRGSPSGFTNTFWHRDFLVCTTLLGLACTAAYLYCGSLYPAIVEHWLVVWVWFFALGGYHRLYGRQ